MSIEQALQLAQTVGVPSVVAICAVWALLKMHGLYAAVQEKRIEDARAYSQQLLAALTELKAQSTTVATAMDNVADAVREQRLQAEALLADRGIHPRPRLGPR
jgi:cytosine/uracil/thiamine/allantoin permease